jgi:CxC2 like cysteine cluster associated with KDZ transposases
MWCNECCVSAHANLPFHCIQTWNGHFFEKSDLLAQQLTLDLCHYPDDCPSDPLNVETPMMFEADISDKGDKCPKADYPSNSFTSTNASGLRSKLLIVSSTGIFHCFIQWCHCTKSLAQYTQLLLCAKLFLASFKNLKTAFTFEVLDHFHVNALECKTAAMNFMSKIQCITDEAFPSHVPVRYLTCPITYLHLQCNTGSLSGATPSLKGVA